MNNMQKIRKKRTNYTTRDIASVIGVSHGMVSNYENDKAPIKPDQACKLADLYGCSVDFLFGRIDERQDRAIQSFLKAVGEITPSTLLRAAGYTLPDSVKGTIGTFLTLSETDRALVISLIDRLAA